MNDARSSARPSRRRKQRWERMLVDQKCADLAIHFLSDVPGSKPEDATELAEIIQARCEDFIADIFGEPA